MYVVGIDPGKHGALVLIDQWLNVKKKEIMPLNKEGQINPVILKGILVDFKKYTEYFYVERQWTRPISGSKQNFWLGYNYSTLKTLLAVLFINPIEITPMAWQKATYKGISGEKKQRSIIAAKKIFNNISLVMKKKDHDGIADALLIAYFGLNVLNESGGC